MLEAILEFFAQFMVPQETMSAFLHQTLNPIFATIYNVFFWPMAAFSVIFYFVAIKGIRLKPKKEQPKKIKNYPKVTVQIPTKNEIVALRCARKCLEFDYPKDKLQIIIGDDSTKPEISKKIDEFAKKHPRVKVTRRGTNEGFKAGNLNHMLKFSAGEVLLLFDSDFIPHKSLVKKMVPHFQDPKVACVQAKWKCRNLDQNLISRFGSAVLKVYMNLLAMINSNNDVSLLFGSAMAIRKSTLKKLGKWQMGSVTEDVEYALRVIREGYRTVYLYDVPVAGEVPFTFRGYFRQQKRWAYGNAKAFKDHFRWLLFGDRLSLRQKSSLVLTLVGYMSAPILIIFTLSGLFFFFSGEPAPINWLKLFNSTIPLILINAGFLAAIAAALGKDKKLGMVFQVIFYSLTVGVVICFGVAHGFLKAVLGGNMDWGMIKKTENKINGVTVPNTV